MMKTSFLLGLVLMMLDPLGTWRVYDPWGNEIAINASDQCQGLQTATDWAILNGFALKVLGGTQRGTGDASRITCNAPWWITASAKTNIELIGVSLACPWTGPIDCIIFDSFDMLDFKFAGGQIIYVGTSAAIKIRPWNIFNEGYDQFRVATSSKFYISTIAIVDPVTWYPEYTHGHAIIIEPTAPITYNDIHVNEVNGGLGSLLVLPPSGGGYYDSDINKVQINFPH